MFKKNNKFKERFGIFTIFIMYKQNYNVNMWKRGLIEIYYDSCQAAARDGILIIEKQIEIYLLLEKTLCYKSI